jgi:hypothetical protein
MGVNVVNPMGVRLADRDTVLRQLQAAGVHVIRCGITADDKGIDFACRAAAKGIRLLLILGPQYQSNAPVRPYQPDKFPLMWSGHPLSAADPELSKIYFQKLFDSLDARGVLLAGVELGNEINWAAFNQEFPLPGEGKILGRADLLNDPEGRQIAAGFLQYLKVLAALKYTRDHSRLNRRVPIVSAGLVCAVDGAKLYNNKKEDMVSLSATIGFLRANGLDSLVDAYGIHPYSSSDHPGDTAAAAKRAAILENIFLAACGSAATGKHKPCWITEWGFQNRDTSCPLKDTDRSLLVQEMRTDFSKAAAEGKLTGIIYFDWCGNLEARHPDPFSIYRCGALTESGRLAIAPITGSVVK